MTAPKLPDPLPRVSTTAVQVRWLELGPTATARMDALAALLDDGERERAARFYFERDRHAYIAAHALVRTLLSAQVPRPPTDWRFSASAHGKPDVIRAADDPPLRFNLSHTHGLVAVAVTLVHDVGIDVETVDPKRLGLELAERTFAPAEVALLRATPAAQVTEVLYAIWTLKEACIKALGQGLSLPLDTFGLTLDPLAVRFSAPLDGPPAEWLLRRLRPTPQHALALALRHPDPEAVHIDACEIAADDLLRLADQLTLSAGQMSRR